MLIFGQTLIHNSFVFYQNVGSDNRRDEYLPDYILNTEKH